VGDLSVPDPRVTNPELFDLRNPNAPIPQFVNAMRMAGIEITAEQVAQGITYEVLKDKDGNPFVVAVYNLDPPLFPEQYRDLAGSIPLLIAKKGEGGWIWETIYYPDLGKNLGIDTSALFDGSSSIELLRNRVRMNFTFATIPYEYSYDVIQNNNRDARYRLSNIRDLGFSGSFMVFHALDTAYILSQNPTSKEHVLNLIRDQLEKVSNLFPDARIFSVWNEIHPPAGHPPYDLFIKFGGMDLVVETYQMAREILGERAILLYNETYNYSFRDGFYPNTKEIVDELRRKSLIDGVGMQMHMFLFSQDEIEPNEEEIIAVMRSYGVPVYITEFDINQVNLSGSNKELQQAQIAYTISSACSKSKVCNMIGFWGVYDGDTWLEYALGITNARPLPFDEEGNPKLFYYAVLKALYDAFVGN
jgi:GH35 family endo-1,4-beta-xylanase